MKTLLFLLALPLSAQTVVSGISLTFPTTAVQDGTATGRTLLFQVPVIAVLQASIGTADTTFTIQANLTGYTATDLYSATSAGLVIDNEQINCTAFVAATGVYSGCTRGQLTTAAATHAAGATVRQVMFSTAVTLIKHFACQGLQQAIQQAGGTSLYLATVAVTGANVANATTQAQTAQTAALAEGTLCR